MHSIIHKVKEGSVKKHTIVLGTLDSDWSKFNLSENEFNESINNIQKQNMIIIRHHYNCSKNDTTFWKKYKEKIKKQIYIKLK